MARACVRLFAWRRPPRGRGARESARAPRVRPLRGGAASIGSRWELTPGGAPDVLEDHWVHQGLRQQHFAQHLSMFVTDEASVALHGSLDPFVEILLQR